MCCKVFEILYIFALQKICYCKKIMKKTVNVAIGGCSFIIDEDAYDSISRYLDNFKGAMEETLSSDEVMDELEGRIADLLKERMGGREVVSLKMAEEVIMQLGYPSGYRDNGNEFKDESRYDYNGRPVKKLFRDTDDKKIAGVCSGLALYLGVDIVIIRVIFLIALICGLSGFWIYLLIWIAAPEAMTAAEKCEMRGIPANAENIRRYTKQK